MRHATRNHASTRSKAISSHSRGAKRTHAGPRLDGPVSGVRIAASPISSPSRNSITLSPGRAAKATSLRVYSRSAVVSTSPASSTSASTTSSSDGSSDCNGLAVFAEDRTEDAAHLAQRCVRVGALDQRRHDVRVGRAWPRRNVAQACERGLYAHWIALRAGSREAGQVAVFRLLRHLKKRDAQLLVRVLMHVDANDLPL